jgi:hypothetical protein
MSQVCVRRWSSALSTHAAYMLGCSAANEEVASATKLYAESCQAAVPKANNLTDPYRHIAEEDVDCSCITGSQPSGLLPNKTPIGQLHAAFLHAWALQPAHSLHQPSEADKEVVCSPRVADLSDRGVAWHV